MARILKSLVVAATWLLLTPAPRADAETVQAARKARLLARPGERARVVKRVPAGKTLTVVERKGRWIKVRAGDQTGWVTRASVRSTRQAREGVRANRRRPIAKARTKRNRRWASGSTADRVGANAVAGASAKRQVGKRSKSKLGGRTADGRVGRRDNTVDAGADSEAYPEEDYEQQTFQEEDYEQQEPARVVVVALGAASAYEGRTSKSPAVFTTSEGQQLYLVEKSSSGKWFKVENGDGGSGWVRAIDVSEQSTAVPTARGGWSYAGDAGIGYSAIGMDFTSNGAGELAAYQVSAGAATLAVGGDVAYSGYGPRWVISADGRYRGTRADPGIRYEDAATGATSDVAVLVHELDVGARLGYQTRRDDGLTIYGRIGYHYGKFAVSEVQDFDINLPRIPSELLYGVTVGGRASMPAVTDKIALSVGIDLLYGGQRQQTVGLEDGETSQASAAWGVAAVCYQWKPNLQVVGGYRISWSKTEWAGQAAGSMRLHGATSASRVDQAHTLTVGLGRTF